MKKIFKKILIIVSVLLFIFIVLFAINLFRNNYILDRIIKTYEEKYSNNDNYYEYNNIKFSVIESGDWNVIQELYVKNNVYLLKYTNQMIGTDDVIEYTYWIDKNTGKSICVNPDGSLRQENVKINDNESYIMRMTKEGKMGYLGLNMFLPIIIEDGYYKIKQNNEGNYLYVNKDTYVIEKRVENTGEVTWDCKIEVGKVLDENVQKPKTTDINLDTLVGE